jgi:large subunit ribosomal protein L1
MGKTKTAFIGTEEVSKNKEKHEKAHKAKEEKVHIAGLKGGQRVKIVEAELPPEEPKEGDAKIKKGSGGRKIVEKIRSKKYQEAKGKIEPGKTYPPAEAIKLVKETSYSKFDGTMELHLVLKKVGSVAQVTLPHSAGREKKVEVASDDTVTKLRAGKIDFDILLSTPEMMPKLVPFAKVLGPKGLMPNPKNGTLVTDPKKLKNYSAATVTLKTEKEAPLVHMVIGKVSQADKELTENLSVILKAFGGEKQIVRAFVKSTMSPSVRVQIV